MLPPLKRGHGLREEKHMTTFFERITRQARATAERAIDRRNPLRLHLIEAQVTAALNQARADERERQARVRAERAAAMARANAAPAAPIRQQCTVVRRGLPVQIVGAPVRREFIPPARHINETFVSA